MFFQLFFVWFFSQCIWDLYITTNTKNIVSILYVLWLYTWYIKTLFQRIKRKTKCQCIPYEFKSIVSFDSLHQMKYFLNEWKDVIYIFQIHLWSLQLKHSIQCCNEFELIYWLLILLHKIICNDNISFELKSMILIDWMHQMN